VTETTTSLCHMILSANTQYDDDWAAVSPRSKASLKRCTLG
jgi:hypothetical protein